MIKYKTFKVLLENNYLSSITNQPGSLVSIVYDSLGVCQHHMQAPQNQASHPADFFMETFLPLLLIQEGQVVLYWQKNGLNY